MEKIETLKKLATFIKAIAAGLAISVGATAYMACDVKIIGALLFTAGLFTICFLDLKLYTGAIGYLLDMKRPWECAVIWCGNAVGCAMGGILLRYSLPSVAQVATKITATKLEIPLLKGAILGIFCGMLMYIAVHNYKKNSSTVAKIVGILVCIPAFIICGFEHCIANVVYFTMGISNVSQLPRILLFMLVVSLANGVGAIAFRKISMAFVKEKVE